MRNARLAMVLSTALVMGSVLAGCSSGSSETGGSSQAGAASEAGGSSGTDTASEAGGSFQAESGSGEASAADSGEKKGYTIGFAAYAMQQEWYQNITAGSQQKADELGIELLVSDADTDAATQLDAIENFITQKVDAIVISPVDVNALGAVVQKAEDAGIKVICESNMIEGAETVVGISNFDAAKEVGTYYAQYARDNNVDPKLLILGYESLENCRQRVEGFKAGMDEAGLDYEIVTEVDGGFREVSLQVATDAFTAHPEINCIFGINDDSTIGAVSAVDALGIDQTDIVAIPYGLEGVAGRGALHDGGMYKFGLASFPEAVGVTCIEAAVEALEGADLPETYTSPTAIVSHEQFEDYFVRENDVWNINFDALSKLGN